MQIVTFIIYVYLLAGFIYALYMLTIGASTLKQFPINMMGGPIMVIYLYYAMLKNKEIKVGD